MPLDDTEGIGEGPHAIGLAKRTLEICICLGAAGPMIEKLAQWNVGKVFHDDRLLCNLSVAPGVSHAFPTLINPQRPYFKRFLHDTNAQAQAVNVPIEICDKNRGYAVTPNGDLVASEVAQPDGPHQVEADWLVTCDGA